MLNEKQLHLRSSGKHSRRTGWLGILLAACALPSFAADPSPSAPVADGISEVQELGRLNGVALACGQTVIAQRIKRVVINTAPKTRRYGEAFEAATQEAFLAQGKPGAAPCPGDAEINKQTETTATRLRQSVPAQGS
ncbi:MAG: hypothetical protein FWD77_09360 [Betaproteobacteria bacterium]|nr:hypothetical protein [Betaproteobacteria bacterium]